jgi:hypothetical protein
MYGTLRRLAWRKKNRTRCPDLGVSALLRHPWFDGQGRTKRAAKEGGGTRIVSAAGPLLAQVGESGRQEKQVAPRVASHLSSRERE